jgi:RNA polymerase sigma-70 factor (ECF subfamily)
MLVSGSSLAKELDLESEDRRSVEAFRAGEVGAFAELARTYRRRIFGTCYRYTANREDAEDLVQEVLLRVYRGLPEFRGEARFRTWLYKITANTCLSWVAGSRRAVRASVPDDLVDPSPSPSERLYAREVAKSVRLAVQKLPGRQRMTLVLRVYEELSYREISEIMECPVGTAKANFFFALKNLKKYLEQEGHAG